MSEQAIDAQQISDWLEQHPDFFIQHPELLDQLELPLDNGKVTSLTAFQNKRLIEQNQNLNRQLKNLSGIAGQNEKRMQRLHRLTLDLANASSLGGLIEQLSQTLRTDFEADVIQLFMHRMPDDLEVEVSIVELPNEPSEWLQQLLDEQTPFCGRLTQEKRQHLLDDQADSLVSAALVPLGEQGLLLIGAESPDRFHPGMGTLFLDLLGQTVSLRLQSLSQQLPSRRSA